jgi:hypothetical protein
MELKGRGGIYTNFWWENRLILKAEKGTGEPMAVI